MTGRRHSPALNFGAETWPSREQLLLLQACLRSGADAVAAWEEWRRRVEFERIDAASQRLMPLLEYNLRPLGVDDPVMGRCRGIARRAWYSNQQLFHRAETVANLLGQRGIPVLALKGMAVAQRYYPETSLRPMSDCDLLVPCAKAEEAIGWLLGQGWQPSPVRRQAELIKYDLRKRHAWNFVDARNWSLDLHWRVLNGAGTAEVEAPFWAAAQGFRLGRTDLLTLCRADHLLHTIVHGLAWNRLRSLRWVVDAMMILRAGPEALDWERLTAQTRRHHVARSMAHALAYLRQHFDAPVPGSVLESIGDIPVAGWERAEFQAMTGPAPGARRRYHLWHRFRRFRHTAPEWQRQSWPAAYADYLLVHWELDHVRQIPGLLARKVAQRFRR